jgi:hypothetical protein
MKPDNKKKKSQNPLYVVTNDGQDVEPVSNLIDAFITKYGLQPVVDTFKMIIDMVLEQVKSYAMFVVIKEFLDELIEKMMELKEKVSPLLAFI